MIKAEYKTTGTNNHLLPVYNTSFAEATGRNCCNLLHKENVYDEYKDQVLLPHEFSRTAPSSQRVSVNGDGRTRLFVGGQNQAGCLYIQQEGKFLKKHVPLFESDKKYESRFIFFDIDKDGTWIFML